jgi:Zn-finger nucleic acid-binding protein
VRSHIRRSASLALATPQGIEIDCWVECRCAWFGWGELDRLLERAELDRKWDLHAVAGGDSDDGHACSTRRDGGAPGRPRRDRSESLRGELFAFGA